MNCKGDLLVTFFSYPSLTPGVGRGKEDLPGRRMTFLGVHSKPPQTWRCKTTEIYQLTVLKARSLKSRCQQGHAPSKGSRKESALASSSKFPITLGVHSWLVTTSPQSFSHCHMALFLCVFSSFFFRLFFF